MHKLSVIKYPNTQLLMMAKVPQAGRVKTRMQPYLSPEQSAQLHTALVDQCLQQWLDAQLCTLKIWVGGELAAFYKSFPQWQFLSHHQQPEGDLGQRMLLATQKSLVSSTDRVVLVGADCPFIDEAYLEQAIMALDNYDVVIGPAMDGGYVLLAMKTPYPFLFTDINWGSEVVFEQTKKKLMDHQLDFTVLSQLHDIDYAEDLPLLADARFSSALQYFSSLSPS